ncbi:unnamed protein product [Mytilus edulis]|uniref:IgGFc-binding protein N-terminal domain-containing protein n=1 Tax=Mytilus edulis TaxID=6550 RepID=A0A8S3SBD4_MYTED|nr:unnamed protein product [Mytilus edulis]
MPLRFASTKYIIPSLHDYTVYYGYKNLMALAPIHHNTRVSIHLKLESGAITYESKKYIDNDIINLVINKYSTLQLSHTSDLSGTMITSSEPIIIVSGSQCNFAVPKGIRLGDCNPFIESVLPTDQLDDMFITPYISTRLNNTVRIQAVNSTDLTILIGKQNIKNTKRKRFL